MNSMKTQILEPTPEHLALLTCHLRKGEVVAIPTETVYGLAGNALDPQAVIRIFSTKDRPEFDPLIVHVADPEKRSDYLSYLESDLGLVDLEDYPLSLRHELNRILDLTWPGPLTVVLTKTQEIPDLVTSGLSSVAIRIPRHPVTQSLLHQVKIPLAAPSANRFGRISPTSTSDVMAELAGRIAYILEGGSCEIGLESTILGVDSSGSLIILRPGGISQEQLATITPLPIRSGSSKAVPGNLTSHYAPTKPFYLLPSPVITLSSQQLEQMKQQITNHACRHLGLLLFSGDPIQVKQWLQPRLDPVEITCHVLSISGDLEEASRKLFSQFRSLDGSSAQVLFTEPCPIQTGLGHAITDRIQRATAHTR
jgi:L-threonylcarbamoyladenylate synthase